MYRIVAIFDDLADSLKLAFDRCPEASKLSLYEMSSDPLTSGATDTIHTLYSKPAASITAMVDKIQRSRSYSLGILRTSDRGSYVFGDRALDSHWDYADVSYAVHDE